MASAGTVKVKVVPDVSDFLNDLEHAVPNGVLMQIMRRAAQDLIFQYSQWLDSEGLIVGDQVSDDKRSHNDLAREFLVKEGH